MIEEGKAKIKVNEGVFYNPKAKLSRDIGVSFVSTIAKKIGRRLRVCEPLAGTGIRGIRYILETDAIEKIVLNDKLPEAYKNIIENLELNGIIEKAEVYNKDANLILEEHALKGKRFDFVDIDPFGSPVYFIQSSLRSLAHKGYLALAATDTAALYGVAKRACIRRYSSLPIKNEFMKEIGIRILMSASIRIASMNELALMPVFVHATMHYIRIYFRMYVTISKIDPILEQIGYIEYCQNCSWRKEFRKIEDYDRNCKICGSKLTFAGPLWLGEIYDKEILNEMQKFQNSLEAKKLLDIISQECNMPPFFYTLDTIASKLKKPEPKVIDIIEKLKANGFRASRTHLHPKGIKTDAEYEEFMKLVSADLMASKN